MDIGSLIKEIRENESMSQERFSNVIGVSQPYLSQIEKGTKKPSVKTLEKIAYSLFGRDLNDGNHPIFNFYEMLGYGTLELQKMKSKENNSLESFSNKELINELVKRNITLNELIGRSD